jgi:hypothetical protein
VDKIQFRIRSIKGGAFIISKHVTSLEIIPEVLFSNLLPQVGCTD